MCIFARFAKIGKKANGSKRNSIGIFFQRHIFNYDMINVISFVFLIISGLILYIGIKVAQPNGFEGVVTDSYEGWLGILVDALLLFSINWALRREERKRLLGQFGSESNDFALDATRQLRKKGWLTDGRLSGIDLVHAQMSNANLSKSILQDVNFSYSNLSGASLVESNLKDSNFTAADLTNAVCRWTDFSGANLRWANLEGAILDGANFEGADLRFAKLGEFNKDTVSLEGAILSETLTDEEIYIVQNSTKLMRKSLDEFANAFYRELFRSNPVVKSLFLTNIRDQARKFAQMFELLVVSLNDVEKIIPSLKALGRRHANYGISEHHYQVVGGALIRTLDKSLGSHFTDEVKNAWLKTYGIVSMIMIDSAKGLI